MNSTELIARVRRKVFFTAAGHPDFTDLVILEEINDTMTTLFERAIVEARSGYWVQTIDIAVTQGIAGYRMPARSCGFEKVELGVGNPPQFAPLHEVSEAHAALFERPSAQLGQPAAFVMRGDRLVLLQTPDGTAYTLRVYYYLRPSRLVIAQSPTFGGYGPGTDAGRITVMNQGTLTATVNAVPLNQEQSSPAAINGTTIVDCVRPNGWHDVSAVSQQLASVVGTACGFAVGADVSRVVGVQLPGIGDYMRAAEQTDWPALPDDFHVCLADATAVKIMTDLNMSAKASLLASAVSADLTRFQSLIAPRIKSEPKTIRAPLPQLRGNRAIPGRYP